MPIQMLLTSPVVFVLFLVSIIVSLTVHEFAHAFIADKLGDPTARYLGRVSLNPLRHLDPIGTLVLLIAGFGWGRPVPFNPNNLRNPKVGSALISGAGPLSNFLLAAIFAFLLHATNFYFLIPFFKYMIIINLSLCFFNLLPVFPLDGEKVVAGFLPYNLLGQWMQVQQYGTFILIALVVTNSVQVLTGPLISISLKLLGLG